MLKGDHASLRQCLSHCDPQEINYGNLLYPRGGALFWYRSPARIIAPQPFYNDQDTLPCMKEAYQSAWRTRWYLDLLQQPLSHIVFFSQSPIIIFQKVQSHIYMYMYTVNGVVCNQCKHCSAKGGIANWAVAKMPEGWGCTPISCLRNIFCFHPKVKCSTSACTFDRMYYE